MHGVVQDDTSNPRVFSSGLERKNRYMMSGKEKYYYQKTYKDIYIQGCCDGDVFSMVFDMHILF